MKRKLALAPLFALLLTLGVRADLIVPQEPPEPVVWPYVVIGLAVIAVVALVVILRRDGRKTP